MNTEQLKRLESIIEKLDGLYDEIHSLQGEERGAQNKAARPEISEANFINLDSAMDKIGLSIAELQEAAARPASGFNCGGQPPRDTTYVRKSLIFEITDEEALPRQLLSPDDKKIRRWLEKNKESLEDAVKNSPGWELDIMPGLRLKFSAGIVSRWLTRKERVSRATTEILAELDRSEQKHPNWPSDQIHAAAVIAEEAGELVRAVNEETWKGADPKLSDEEAVQTAAMCLRFILNREGNTKPQEIWRKEK
jgi:NTP pyrophosphatase (non-canonical NTP hydrolase)